MPNWRDELMLDEKVLFLNHAAIAPLSRRAVEAMRGFNDDCARHGSLGWHGWQEKVAAVRRQAAALLGVSAEEIAFTGNTSGGLATVAEGFPWQSGDTLLYVTPDYPANVYPWQHLARRGVAVRSLARREGRIDLVQLAAALVPGVRLLAVSSVDFASGCAADLEAIGALCREREVLLAVDAIQSLGVLPIDVRRCGIHFLAAGGHKWLLGPLGTGILYVERSWCHRLDPPLVGWKSVVDEENFDLHFQLRTDAARFEPGSLNFSGLYGLGASLGLLAEIGVDEIRARVGHRVAQVIGGCRERGLRVLTPEDPADQAGIVTFVPRGEPGTVFRRLLAEGVLLSLRGGGLRVSPHFYTGADEIERFLQLLDQCDEASGRASA